MGGYVKEDEEERKMSKRKNKNTWQEREREAWKEGNKLEIKEGKQEGNKHKNK
jgi:hypothetical protein